MARQHSSPPQFNAKPPYNTFGDFLTAKRREKEITSTQICGHIGISPGYYCDIEKNRRYPPDRKTLARIVQALHLSGEDKAVFYDLAGQARSEAPPDLPDYINGNEAVRVALRLAKSQGNANDWKRFITMLKNRQGGEGK
jgi:transcriptional regulator with XRE-family HTH domain